MDNEDRSLADLLMEREYWDLDTMIAWVDTRNPGACARREIEIQMIKQYWADERAQIAFLKLRKAFVNGEVRAWGRHGLDVSDRDSFSLDHMRDRNLPPREEIRKIDWHDAHMSRRSQSSLGSSAALFVETPHNQFRHIIAPRAEVLAAFPPEGDAKEREQPDSTKSGDIASGDATDPAKTAEEKVAPRQRKGNPVADAKRKARNARLKTRLDKLRREYPDHSQFAICDILIEEKKNEGLGRETLRQILTGRYGNG